MSSDEQQPEPVLPASETQIDFTGQQPPQRSARERMHWIFFGPHGLRAGWACLLFLAVLFVLGLLAGRLLKLVPHSLRPSRGGAIGPLQMIFGEGVSIAVVLLATYVLSLIERRSFLSFGLRGRASISRFLAGLVCGFAAISALVGLLWKLGLLTLGSAHLSAGQAFEYALLWGFGFFCVAVFEESLLRGYLLYTLRRGIGFWPAAILLSALFGFSHHSNPGESPVGLFSAAAVGLLFCLAIWYTGSLWWAIGFHAAWDWGESYFWSTSDSGLQVKGHLLNEQPHGPLLWSGGPTGPEGSLWVLVILLLSALLMYLWWRRKPRELAQPIAVPVTIK
jgi:membrane protease YdiL (CAAX protease family)